MMHPTIKAALIIAAAIVSTSLYESWVYYELKKPKKRVRVERTNPPERTYLLYRLHRSTDNLLHDSPNTQRLSQRSTYRLPTA